MILQAQTSQEAGILELRRVRIVEGGLYSMFEPVRNKIRKKGIRHKGGKDRHNV